MAGAQREDQRLQPAGDGAHRDPDGPHALPPSGRESFLGLRVPGGRAVAEHARLECSREVRRDGRVQGRASREGQIGLSVVCCRMNLTKWTKRG